MLLLNSDLFVLLVESCERGTRTPSISLPLTHASPPTRARQGSTARAGKAISLEKASRATREGKGEGRAREDSSDERGQRSEARLPVFLTFNGSRERCAQAVDAERGRAAAALEVRAAERARRAREAKLSRCDDVEAVVGSESITPETSQQSQGTRRNRRPPGSVAPSSSSRRPTSPRTRRFRKRRVMRLEAEL